ncbi:MAG: hypothetical protein AMXMBFR19_22260, partial [Chthonomonadaceae bacterium]
RRSPRTAGRFMSPWTSGARSESETTGFALERRFPS